MNAQPTLAQPILDFVKERRGGVSFVELARDVPGFSVEHGDPGFVLEAGKRNIVIWPGLTQSAAEAMDWLHSTGAIEYAPTSPLTYLIDGGGLSLPVVKRAPRAGRFKSPHWLPTVVNLPAKRGR